VNNLSELIAVARGDRPADLILKNARVVNTFNGSIEQGNIAICGDRIAAVGDYTAARQAIDVSGEYVAPGLINGHVHIESSMLHPTPYAEAVVPRGTSTVVTDLHEIANVCGFAGIDFVHRWAEQLPLDMFFMVPSCVPATNLETGGVEITAPEIKAALKLPNVLGLGEMMNYPGVIYRDKGVLQKLQAARDKITDGHAPQVSGRDLNAYIAAGIRSDHECTGLKEAKEKLGKGMYIMIREGSSEKNLDELLPLVNENTWTRCFFVVDDRSCSDLFHEGDIDAVVRKAITRGLHPIRAIQMATITPAQYFRLYNHGGIGPGYMANLVTISDLAGLTINRVFYQGKLVASKGELLAKVPDVKAELSHSINFKPFNIETLKLLSSKRNFPVIQIIPGQIITRKLINRIKTDKGTVQYDLDRDILKLAVIERHKATGNIGLGLVKGFGLKCGALASSIAHDSHNIIAVGTNDRDIYRAVMEIKKMGGGLAVCAQDKMLASLPLPIAGLLSDKHLDEVVRQHNSIEKAAANLGELPPAPFGLLSFLALPVIPQIRLTDKGLVDVERFELISTV
jgi:adenine deaminase